MSELSQPNDDVFDVSENGIDGSEIEQDQRSLDDDNEEVLNKSAMARCYDKVRDVRR